ncbi:MAG: DNRLRE domain-containing protein [Bacteroidota bacterium]
MKTILFSFLIVSSSAFTQVTTLNPISDVSLGYHDNYNTENNNYSTAPQFAGFVQVGTQGGVNSNRGLIKFDLSSISQTAVIDSAKLFLYMYNGYSGGPLTAGHYGDNECYLRRVTSDWGDLTVSWNTQPSATTVDEVTLSQSTSSNQDYVVRVDNIVQYMVNNPSLNYGMKLGLVNEVIGNNLSFHSNNSLDPLKRPTLVVYVRTADLEENTSTIFNCYPNPANDNLTLELIDGKKDIKIYDAVGKTILEISELEDSKITVDITNFNSGIYFVSVVNGSKSFTKKIIKE